MRLEPVLALALLVAWASPVLPAGPDSPEGAPVPPYAACRLSSWSAWSECSVPCGPRGGSQQRTRVVLRPAGELGRPCPPVAGLAQERRCNVRPCPVDCELSEWSAWSPCSAECGEGGLRARTRQVARPAALGGEPCVGAQLVQHAPCDPLPPECKPACFALAWGEWEPCGGARCGNRGAQARTRKVVRVPGGKGPCELEHRQVRHCVVRAGCPGEAAGVSDAASASSSRRRALIEGAQAAACRVGTGDSLGTCVTACDPAGGGCRHIITTLADSMTSPFPLPAEMTFDSHGAWAAMVTANATNLTVHASVYSMPRFGRLYQLNADGSMGARLDTSDGAVDVADAQLRLVYVPPDGRSGARMDRMDYRLCVSPAHCRDRRVANAATEGCARSCAERAGTVEFTVNTAPVAPPVSRAYTALDEPVSIVLRGEDAEGDELQFTLRSLPSSGTLSWQSPQGWQAMQSPFFIFCSRYETPEGGDRPMCVEYDQAPQLSYVPGPGLRGRPVAEILYTVTDAPAHADGGSSFALQSRMAVVELHVNTVPFPLNFHLEYEAGLGQRFALQASDTDGDALRGTITSLPEAEVDGTLVDNRGTLSQICSCPRGTPRDECGCGRRVESVPVPVASERMLLSYRPVLGPGEYGRPYARFKFTASDFMSSSAFTGEVTININSPPVPAAPTQVNVNQGDEILIEFGASDVDVDARAAYPVSVLVPSTLPYPLQIQGQPTNTLSAVLRATQPSLEPMQWDGVRLTDTYGRQKLRVRPGETALLQDMAVLYSPPLALRGRGVSSVRLAYAANDSMILSEADSTVTVLINWEPEGMNSSYVIVDDAGIRIELPGTDPNTGDPLSVAVEDYPSLGELFVAYDSGQTGGEVRAAAAAGQRFIPVALNAEHPAVFFMPPRLTEEDPDAISVSFTYSVFDGVLTGSVLGHVHVRIKRRNRPPSIPAESLEVEAFTVEDKGVLLELNGTDPDAGDTVVAVVTDLPERGELYQYAAPSGAAARRVEELEALGKPVPAALLTGARINNSAIVSDPRMRVVFKPEFRTHSGDTNGPYASFSYQVSDGIEQSEEIATVSIHVDGRPVGAPSEVLATFEDTEVYYNCSGEDPEGAPVTAIVYSTAGRFSSGLAGSGAPQFQPELFELRGGAELPILPTMLPYHLGPAGQLVYRPPKDAHMNLYKDGDGGSGGPARTGAFTYRVTDGTLLSVEPTTVAIQVIPVNDPPHTSTDFVIQTPEQTPITFSLPSADVDIACESFNVSVPNYATVEIFSNETNYTTFETVLVNITEFEQRECAQQPTYAALVRLPANGTGELQYTAADLVLSGNAIRSAWISVEEEGLKPGELRIEALDWNAAFYEVALSSGGGEDGDGGSSQDRQVASVLKSPDEIVHEYVATHAYSALGPPDWLVDILVAKGNQTGASRSPWIFPIVRLGAAVTFVPPPCPDYFRRCQIGEGVATFAYAAIDGEGALSDSLTTVDITITPRLDEGVSRFERYPSFAHTVQQGALASYDAPPEGLEDPTGVTNATRSEWMSPKRSDLMRGFLYSWGRNDDASQLGLGAAAPAASAEAALAAAAADAAALEAASAAVSSGAKDAAVESAATAARSSALAARASRSAFAFDASVRDFPALSEAAEASGIDFMSVAAGDGHAFGIDIAGQLYSWGLDLHGRLGHPPPLHASHAAKAHPRSHPYRPPGSYADAVDEAMDESARSCDAAGCVYFSPQPVLALRDVRVRHVYACLGHAMALADDGTVYTWGDDARGQLGRGLGNAELLLGARRDAAYALAAMAGGGGEQVSADEAAPPWRPMRVAALEGHKVIAGGVGATHSAALTANGALYTWGSNAEGQLGLLDCLKTSAEGNGTCQTHALTSPAAADTPQPVEAFRVWDAHNVSQGQRGFTRGAELRAVRVEAIGIGWYYTLALGANGQVYSWGYGVNGQLGLPRRQHFQSPDVRIVNMPTAVRALEGASIYSLHASRHHSGAVTRDGHVFMWGDNAFGQLGVGDRIARFEPTLIRGLSGPSGAFANISTIALGDYHTLALSDVGHVFAWGSNAMGQAGTSARYAYRRERIDPETGNLTDYLEWSDVPLHHAPAYGREYYDVLPEAVVTVEDVGNATTGLRLTTGTDPTRPAFARGVQRSERFGAWAVPRQVAGTIQIRDIAAGGLFSLAVRSACPRGLLLNASTGGCEECPRGHEVEGLSMLACQPCPRGTARPPEASGCAACAAGTYMPNEGATRCLRCKAGTFNSFEGASSARQCLECPAGTFAAEPASTECTQCPFGEYQAEAGSTGCLACPEGTFSTAVGAVSEDECVACPAGSEGAQEGALGCALCPRGTRNALPGGGKMACELCGPGMYADVRGARDCEPCPHGTYHNVSGAASVDECLPCPVGSFGAALGAVECEPCPIATFSARPGATLCERCAAGFRGMSDAEVALVAAGISPAVLNSGPADQITIAVDGVGLVPASAVGAVAGGSMALAAAFESSGGRVAANLSCTACLPGTFGATGGASECLPCAMGTFSAAAGALSCRACPVGTHLNISGMWAPESIDTSSGDPVYSKAMAAPGKHPCEECPLGSFAPTEGLDNCLLCPPGSFSNLTGSFKCIECEVLSRTRMDRRSATLHARPVSDPRRSLSRLRAHAARLGGRRVCTSR